MRAGLAFQVRGGSWSGGAGGADPDGVSRVSPPGTSPCLRPENMVHHTMKISNTSASSASTNNKSMGRQTGKEAGGQPRETESGWHRVGRTLLVAGIVGSLAACALLPEPTPHPERVGGGTQVPADDGPLPPAIPRGKSLWLPVRWADLPGWGQDNLYDAWNAWLKGCERPNAAGMPGQLGLCTEVRQLSIASLAEQQAWVQRRFQPYRVAETDGSPPAGLLTGYYEPVLDASRQPSATYRVPLYAPPPGLSGQRWYSRQEIDTLPAAQAALRGRALAWLADPIDALVLQIQGSGRINITEPDGQRRQVRLAFAGHNGHPYQSVGRWLLDQGAIREGSWEAIRAWARANPARVSDLLWRNPRTVFFREEVLSELDARFGPKGAQGVALTPGRSIAVDPQSIPYGTPVWLATPGPTLTEQKLVLAQDTGSAIVGAVRADLFTGWGEWHEPAYLTAAALKQPLQLWVLWPR